MKTVVKALLIAITFFSLSNVHAQTWTYHNAGTVGFIMSISFPTNDSGYVVTDYGQIRKTFDGALTWSGVTQPPTPVYSVLFLTGQTGFAFGDSTVYKTNNAGATWTPVLSPGGVFFRNMHFPNSTTGYLTAEKTTGDSIRLFKTTNGGITWSQVARKRYYLLDCGLYFLNSTEGFWSTDFEIYSTTNGGMSFSNSYSDISQAQTFVNYSFPSIDTGYSLDYAALVRTYNGGATWTEVNIPAQVTYDLYFSTGEKGFICGGNMNGWIAETADAGMTWTTAYSTPYVLVCMDFPSDFVGYSGGQNGTVIKYSGTITAIEPEQNESSISIYPNPTTNGRVIIEAGKRTCDKLEIYNSVGQMVQEQALLADESNQVVVEGLDAGIYYVRVLFEDGEWGVKELVVL